MDLIRSLGELAEPPGPEQVRTARMLRLAGEPTRAEYTDLFVVQLYPYASVYLGPEGQLGGQVQDHMAGFWRVLRQPVPRDPDHIATLFSTYAGLTQQARDSGDQHLKQLLQQMRQVFLWEHLASWLLPFVARVGELGSATYRGWASLVLDALEAEAIHVGQPALLPLHLRNAPALPASRAPDELVAMLFSPVRSGIILTRADLTRCARDLGIATRVAERRYTLRTMLSQDSARVGAWLGAEARRQADRMHAAAEPFRSIASYWEQRALATANLITNATSRSEVRGVQGGLPARD
ncbi:MAG: TorD/DmsD family molecular chaperone [Gemmatimonadota bacterium]